MRLADFLDKQLILPDLKSGVKKEVLAELLAPLALKFPHLDVDGILTILMDRESLGSTGIGDGVAIPHGKLEDLDQVILVAGRSGQGVDFQSLDHKPAHIFFLVLAPEQVAGMHLRILATVSRMLQDPLFRQEFMHAESLEGLWSILTRT